MSIHNICSLVLLGINTVTDIKCKKVCIVLNGIFFLGGIILNITNPQYSIYSLIGGCLLGICFMGISRLTKEAVGMGDGIVIMVLGIYAGFYKNISTLLYSSFLYALISVLLLSLKIRGRKDRIAFIPGLFAGFIIVLLGGE